MSPHSRLHFLRDLLYYLHRKILDLHGQSRKKMHSRDDHNTSRVILLKFSQLHTFVTLLLHGVCENCD